MTTDPSYWPVSGPDQDVYTSDLAKQVAKLRHSIKPIVVHKFFEPTQTDWEQKWSLKTGLYPPIPPGVKLLWYSLSSGEMRYYTTVWNLDNGVDYDGTVYPVRPSTEDTSYFRFLGDLGRRGTLLSAFSKPDTTITTLVLDPLMWVQKGLLRLVIEFSLTITTSSVQLRLSQGNASYSNDYQTYEDASPLAPDPTVIIFDSSWTPTAVLTTGIAAKISSDVTIREYMTAVLGNPGAAYPFIGRLEISLGLSAEDEKQYFAPITSLEAAILDGAAPGNIVLYKSAWSRRVATLPGRDQIFMADSLTYNVPLLGDENDRAWVYGIFNTPTDSDLGEYR